MSADPKPVSDNKAERPQSHAAPTPVICFSIRAVAEPGILPRVLEVFAKRSLVPQRLHADRTGGPDSEELFIDLQIAGLSVETGAFLARCLRQIWGVDAVLTAEKGYA
jgi:hypothetical protein